MGKTVFILVFLGCMATALVLFLMRDETTIRENMELLDLDEPRIKFNKFKSVKYEEETVISILSADKAEFFSPNFVEARGKVFGWSQNDAKQKSVRSDFAKIYFVAKGITDIFNDPQIDEAFVRGNVSIVNGKETAYTEFAKYLAREKRIVSDKPIKLVSPKKTFMGNEGFTLNLESEELQIFGVINGVVY